ncbi:poly a polymerase head domain-containing protein [Colletotrichum tabaci]|uniref:Poly a polymerase head domain-containing protein n=1 Tax=Colletotrichum tabaci TaxID=1209068 RepID=A0AAV9TNT5_9PEZI
MAATTHTTIVASTVHPKFSLTAKERQLRDLLVDVAAFIDAAGRSPEPLVLRWAGGWVRDKLLGIESHDIDTAINAMTGYAFSLELRDYCAQHAHTEKHNIGPDDMGSLHRIAANPDKSKHLETATTRMFGLDVDFVNLRKETYTQDSRNPTMEFGTAEEDALRRDATINALFYNLHTGLVEDFTGGLADMESRLVRTPMEPFQTFTDDPLRVLRLVRFASRLDFSIDTAATAVMADARVLDALRLKISRERVGVEMEKMLKGSRPRSSLDLIRTLGLYNAIFTDPNGMEHPRPDLTKWQLVYDLLDSLIRDRAPGSIYNILVKSDEAAYFAWNLAAITPYAHVEKEIPLSKARVTLPLTTLVAREVATERDKVGMAVRKWDNQGGYWRVQVLYALLVEASEKLTPDSDADTIVFLSGWKSFLGHLADLDVMDAPSLRRLVDGRMLAKELGIRPVLPGQYTLGNLANDLAECESLTQIRVLEVLSLCLKRIDRIDQGPQDEEPIQHLANHAAGFLHNPAASYCVDSLALAETALDVLRSLVVGFSAQLGEEYLIRVTAYTNNHDTWTTLGAASSAEDILRHSLNDDTRPRLLGDTGLGEIFQQSVFPSLLSLPGSTPEDESLQLLVPAYNAIVQLAEAQFPDDEARPQKTKLLVKLLTEGILAGYWHASEYIRIVELLAQQIIPIVHQLGQSAIPHMKAGTSVHGLRHYDRPVSRFTTDLHPSSRSSIGSYHVKLLAKDR